MGRHGGGKLFVASKESGRVECEPFSAGHTQRPRSQPCDAHLGSNMAETNEQQEDGRLIMKLGRPSSGPFKLMINSQVDVLSSERRKLHFERSRVWCAFTFRDSRISALKVMCFARERRTNIRIGARTCVSQTAQSRALERQCLRSCLVLVSSRHSIAGGLIQQLAIHSFEVL